MAYYGIYAAPYSMALKTGFVDVSPRKHKVSAKDQDPMGRADHHHLYKAYVWARNMAPVTVPVMYSSRGTVSEVQIVGDHP